MICYKCMNEFDGNACPNCGFNPASYVPFPTALPPMTMLHGQYVLGDVLGKGGFGITYIGFDNDSCQKVAIKEYFPSSIAYRDGLKTTQVSIQAGKENIHQRGVEKFFNEAVTLSKLQNIPAVVDIYNFFYENNTAYIVMEYLPGPTINQIVNNQGPLDLGLTLTFFYPIIQAMQPIHDNSILHRDITPSNIILDKKYNARLIDFGSSREYSPEISSDPTVFIKKGFAPPEQYTKKGKHGPTEDVYSICASMYYTLTGKVPPESLDRNVFDTLKPIHSFRSDIPVEVENVILKGLTVDSEYRYSDMRELANAIDQTVNKETPEQKSSVKQQESKQTRYQSHSQDNLLLGLLLGASALLILLVLILFFSL